MTSDPRIEAFKAQLQEMEATAAIVTHPLHKAYLSRYYNADPILCELTEPRDLHRFLWVDANAELGAEAADYQNLWVSGAHEASEIIDFMVRRIERAGLRNAVIGVELDHLPSEQVEWLREALPGVEWRNIGRALRRLRAIKDDQEREWIRKALAIAEDSLRAVFDTIVAGNSPREMITAFECEVIRRGGRTLLSTFSDEPWLDVHPYLPSQRGCPAAFESGVRILFDVIVSYRGYIADIAPVFCIGEPPRELAEQQEYAWRCKESITALVTSGMTTLELYEAAQQMIERDLGPYRWGWFGWCLHGTGLAVHEEPMSGSMAGPRGYRYAGVDEPMTIEPNMMVSVESMCEAAYEITEEGARLLSSLPQRLIVL